MNLFISVLKKTVLKITTDIRSCCNTPICSGMMGVVLCHYRNCESIIEIFYNGSKCTRSNVYSAAVKTLIRD